MPRSALTALFAGTVIVAGIIAKFGLSGLLMVTAMSGILLIAMIVDVIGFETAAS